MKTKIKRIKYLKITFGTTYIYMRVKNVNLESKMRNIINTLKEDYPNVMVHVGDKSKFDI